MALIPPGLSLIEYFGATIPLTTTGTLSPSWLGGIKALYQPNGTGLAGSGGTGWKSAKPTRPAPTVASLTDGNRYLLSVTTAFELTGAQFVGTAPAVTPPAAPPATYSDTAGESRLTLEAGTVPADYETAFLPDETSAQDFPSDLPSDFPS